MTDNLHPFGAPGTLRGYTRFADTYRATVELQESSAVAMRGQAGAYVAVVPGDEPPDFCWLRIRDGANPTVDLSTASAHLDREQARELRDALDAFLSDGRDIPHDSRTDHE